MPLRRALAFLAVVACSSGPERDPGPSLDDFLPDIPEPTGEAQTVRAGELTADRIPGGAAVSAVLGDYFLENERARFIVQSEARVIGVVPQGGNLVDAVLLDGGEPLSEDQLGEVSMNYLVGRTCEHTRVEVVQDGAGGGAAAIVARGVAAPNDYINLRGTGILPINADLDPDFPDAVECATTYVLLPGATHLEIYWTLFNPGERAIATPFAALSDTGGSVETWAPTRGFERAGIEAIAGGLGPAPIEYDVFQGPGVAYGILPVHAGADVRNSAYLIAGVSIVLFGATQFLDALRPEGVYLEIPIDGGVTAQMDFAIGRDAADIDEQYRARTGDPTVALAGRADLSSGAPAVGARVGLFLDVDGDGEVGVDDPVVSYLDALPDGTFAGRAVPGEYLVQAEIAETSRSVSLPLDLTADQTDLAIELPAPVTYDFTVTDAETGAPIPAKLTVLGVNPAVPDGRLFPASDRRAGIALMRFAARGTTVDLGDGADPRLLLPAGGRYRVIASHGPEWSYAIADLDPQAGDPIGELGFELRRVVDTAGYVATEYHVHSIGSPDSPVGWEERVRTAAVDGVEVWASTEHDYIADLQPLIEELGLAEWTRALPGAEVTPFAYGHFIGFPLARDPASPSGGAVDWGRGADGFSLLPGDVMAALFDLGAEIVQVNHPRTPGSFQGFAAYFSRVALGFDYESRTIDGDPARQAVPNEFLRLEPGASLWSLGFNALEVWNNLSVEDSDGDGVRDAVGQDQMLRDWFNFLSFGVAMTPLGNSDTHDAVQQPVGMPRTMVRVADDSPAAIADGSLLDTLYDSLAGRGGAPVDVVVTNGPMIRVTEASGDASVIGATLDGQQGVALAVSVQAAPHAPFDTIEVFANATPAVGLEEYVLDPLVCFTTRPLETLSELDPCARAPLGALPLTVEEVAVGDASRLEAAVEVALSAADVAAVTREGATGADGWIVIRARGQSGVFPLYTAGLDASDEALLRGDAAAIAEAVRGQGLPASAFTAPVRVDFDGGGYRAPFAPQ